MAGDRGMRYPELTAGALQHLSLPAGCTDGYSSSRTCEINMSQHSGINFRCAALLLLPLALPSVLHGIILQNVLLDGNQRSAAGFSAFACSLHTLSGCGLYC